jgi:predicted anti-sigma-YlaC factor YlaD
LPPGRPAQPTGRRGNFPPASRHYYCMECDRLRVAISTQIDGEVPWLPPTVLEEHLADCADCRDWQRRAHTVTRRVRLGGAFLDHDLAPQVLAALPVNRDRGRLRLARRGLLIALALAQLAIAAPMLFLGRDHEAGLHAAHELGSFNLALAIAFAVGAVRPKLSAGLAWPCAIAAAGLVGTAVIDLIGGQAIGADEAQHLIALAGAALLVWQAGTAGAQAPAPAVAPAVGPAATPAEETEVGTAATPRPGAAPGRPWGGDAARLTEPGEQDGQRHDEEVA